MNSFLFRLTAGVACLLMVLGYSIPATGADDAVEMTKTSDTLRLFSFEGREPLKGWRVINDDVSGGVSEGAITRAKRGQAVFEGNISLKNDGGYSSVRADLGDVSLANYDGLMIRVRGDGREYRLVAKTNRDDDSHRYEARFKTTKDTWQVLKVSFKDFKPYWRGMRLYIWDNCDADDVKSVGLMISDEIEGPFRLEIDSIDAYRSN